MRVLDLADGAESASPPTQGTIVAAGLATYVDDAAFVAANGTATLGDAYLNTSLNLIRFYDGSTWVSVVTANGIVALTNKDIDGGTASNTNRITLSRGLYADLVALTRKEGTILYATDRDKVYVDDGTTLRPLGSGGGGSALRWLTDEAGISPLDEIANNMRVWTFQQGATQKLFALIKVPSSYNAGDQIRMLLSAFSISTANNWLLQSLATLIRKNTDAITTTTNQRTSTNTELTNTVSNQMREVSLDLTSATGTINSVSVAAGDIILVQVTRATTVGTDDTADLKVVQEGTEVTFS